MRKHEFYRENSKGFQKNEKWSIACKKNTTKIKLTLPVWTPAWPMWMERHSLILNKGLLRNERRMRRPICYFHDGRNEGDTNIH